MVTIRNTDEIFDLEGGLLKMIINKSYSIDLATLSDKEKV